MKKAFFQFLLKRNNTNNTFQPEKITSIHAVTLNFPIVGPTEEEPFALLYSRLTIILAWTIETQAWNNFVLCSELCKDFWTLWMERWQKMELSSQVGFFSLPNQKYGNIYCICLLRTVRQMFYFLHTANKFPYYFWRHYSHVIFLVSITVNCLYIFGPITSLIQWSREAIVCCIVSISASHSTRISNPNRLSSRYSVWMKMQQNSDGNSSGETVSKGDSKTPTARTESSKHRLDDGQTSNPGGKADGNVNMSTDWVCVGRRDSIPSRTPLKIHGRQVTLLRIPPENNALKKLFNLSNERWTCIDSICYHAGGPLMQGAVRTVAGRTCIECPWHRYLIDAFTGDGLYMDMSRTYQSKGVRQRVHQVQVRNDNVYVRLSTLGDIPSDEYAYVGKYLIPDNSEPVRCIPDWWTASSL